MLVSLLLALLLAAPDAARLQSAGPGIAQEEELPDDRPEIAELLEELSDCAKARGEKDAKASLFIGRLRQEFPGSGPRDRKAIVKGLDRCLNVFRRTTTKGERPNRIYLDSAKALGSMGPESVDTLLKWIPSKRHKDFLDIQRELILSLGSTRDSKAIEPLLKLLDEFQARLQAAAAEALGNFTEEDQKVRKKIFEELLKTMMSAQSSAEGNSSSSTAGNRWSTVAGPIRRSLQALSGTRAGNHVEWQRWWNKNKRRDWDEGR